VGAKTRSAEQGSDKPKKRGIGMEFQDKTLTCKDCGEEFVFTAGEQEFYAEKGFENEPGRCRECRAARKRERANKPRQMFEVVCSQCGITTEVPFEPKDGRPVYCRDCYEAKRRAI
jgi:CxxC-x17-CxxC domain-containing protein